MRKDTKASKQCDILKKKKKVNFIPEQTYRDQELT